MRRTPLATVCAVGMVCVATARGQDAASASPAQSAAAKGDSLMRAGRTADAVEVWRAALAGSARDVTLLWKTSMGLSALAEETPGHEGDEALLKKSVEVARRAVRYGPQVSRAHTALAIALGRYGRHLGYAYRIQRAGEVIELGRQAYAENERARQLDPTDYAPYVFLGVYHRELATVHPVAKAIARTFLGGFPDVSLEESAALLERAVELDPESVTARVQLARTWLAMGKVEEARAELEMASGLEPRSRTESLEIERFREALAARS